MAVALAEASDQRPVVVNAKTRDLKFQVARYRSKKPVVPA